MQTIASSDLMVHMGSSVTLTPLHDLVGENASQPLRWVQGQLQTGTVGLSMCCVGGCSRCLVDCAFLDLSSSHECPEGTADSGRCGLSFSTAECMMHLTYVVPATIYLFF